MSIKKRDSNQEKLGDVWEKLIKAYGLGKNYKEYLVIQATQKTLGAYMMRYTSDIYFNNGRLRVQVTNGVIREELNMAKTVFLTSINEELGEKIVLDVVFN